MDAATSPGSCPTRSTRSCCAPQRDALIAGNWVHDNSATDAPTKRLEYPAFGIGILIAGGRDNLVRGNLVADHATYGIAILPNLDDNLWLTRDNEVRDNVVAAFGTGRPRARRAVDRGRLLQRQHVPDQPAAGHRAPRGL